MLEILQARLQQNVNRELPDVQAGYKIKRHTLFSWATKSPWLVSAVTKLKDACSLEEKL